MIAVVGEDFLPEHEAVLTERGIDTRGHRAGAGAELSLDGSVCGESERGEDAGYGPECVRDV